MKLFKNVLTATVFAALATFISGVHAENFPSKTVTMIVPFSAGGGTDRLARVIQPHLEKVWGQTVVIENKPGASGLVGALSFLGEPTNDGHKILFASTGAILSLAREGKGIEGQAFKVEKVLQPISQVSQPPYIATVHPSLDVKNIPELIAYAKKNPGEVTFGSSGVGSASHLTGVLFEQMAGVTMNHVPYSGMGKAGPALLSGEVKVLFAPAPVVNAGFSDGSLRGLALTTGSKSTLYPELPTIDETLKGFSIAGWFGLFAHPATPADRVQALNKGVQEVLSLDSVARDMAASGGDPAPMSTSDYTRFVNADVSTWRGLQAIVDGK